MQKREFLMLAHLWNPIKHKTEGSFLSEKLDGVRCVWIPSTRDMDFQSIPFANTNKDDRAHVCSGLWSRYGKPIFAPDWFLDQFPTDHALDGELYVGRQCFQLTTSYVKKHKPINDEWKQVGFYAFDIPSYVRLFEPGRINNPNFEEKIIPNNCNLLVGVTVDNKWYEPRRYEYNWQYLAKNFRVAGAGELRGEVGVLRQDMLPVNRFKAEEIVNSELERVSNLKGEGLILRRPHSLWQPKRTDEILKVKKMHDHEGVVIGYTYGVGKLHGMMGSVRLRADFGKGNVEFDLSGYTDIQRAIRHEYRKDANYNPGKYVTHDISEFFPLGSKITFKYRELTRDGKPKEARYMRPYSGV